MSSGNNLETKMTTTNLPVELAKKNGYQSPTQHINSFKNISLYELIKQNSKTKFLTQCTKYSYKLNY